MLTVNDFKAGDIVILTKRGKQRGRYTAQVTSVNFEGSGLVTYSGSLTGQGAFDPTTLDSPSRFQTIVGIEKTDRSMPLPGPSWTPKPGNLGYDLMC